MIDNREIQKRDYCWFSVAVIVVVVDLVFGSYGVRKFKCSVGLSKMNEKDAVWSITKSK